MSLPGFSNSQKLSVSASATLYNTTVAIIISDNCGLNNIDMTKIIVDLGINKYKFAVEYEDSGVELYGEWAWWDEVGLLAVLHVKLPQINTSPTYLTLHWDITHADNTTYIGQRGSTAGITAQESTGKIVLRCAENTPVGLWVDSSGNSSDVTGYGGLSSVVTDIGAPGVQFDTSQTGWADLGADIAGELLGDYTIACRVKYTDVSRNTAVFSINQADGDNVFLFYNRNESKQNVQAFNSSGSAIIDRDAGTVRDGSYHTLVFSYDRDLGVGTFYFDGAWQYDDNASGIHNGNTDQVSLGQEYDGGNRGDYWAGVYADVQIHTGTKSDAWADLYQRSLSDNLVTWQVKSFTEHESVFSVAQLFEQFYNLSTGPALSIESESQYRVSPAIKFDYQQDFYTERSLVFEHNSKFYSTGHVVNENEEKYFARGTLGLREQGKSFYANYSQNYIFEDESKFIASWRSTELTTLPSSCGVLAIIDGISLPVISITGGRTGYFYSFSILCPENSFTRSIATDSQLQLRFFNKPYDEPIETLAEIELFIYSVKSDWQAGNNTQSTNKTIAFECRSATAGLDVLPNNRGALLIDKEWESGTKVSDIMGDIHPPDIPYSVQSVDYTISQKYESDKRTPAQIEAELFAGLWVGPTNTGGLLVRRKLPVRPGKLINADPDYVLDPSEYIISSSTSDPTVNYYNQVTAGTVATSDSIDLRAPIIEQSDDSNDKATIYGYRVPFAEFELKTSLNECSGALSYNKYGVTETVEITKEVDFEDGEASFPFPITELKSIDWGCNDSLGQVTPSEDGKLVAELDEHSLAVKVTCLVKRKKFLVTRHFDKTVKFWFEDYSGNTSESGSY